MYQYSAPHSSHSSSSLDSGGGAVGSTAAPSSLDGVNEASDIYSGHGGHGGYGGHGGQEQSDVYRWGQQYEQTGHRYTPSFSQDVYESHSQKNGYHPGQHPGQPVQENDYKYNVYPDNNVRCNVYLEDQDNRSGPSLFPTTFLVQAYQAYEHAMHNFLPTQAIWYAERMVADASSLVNDTSEAELGAELGDGEDGRQDVDMEMHGADANGCAGNKSSSSSSGRKGGQEDARNAKFHAIYLLARAYFQDKNMSLAYFHLKQLIDEALATKSKAFTAFSTTEEKEAASGSASGLASGLASGSSASNNNNNNHKIGSHVHETIKSARYLLARCCYDLGKYAESEEALGESIEEKAEAIERQKRGLKPEIKPGLATGIPGGAAGYYLLGQIRERERAIQAAIEAYKNALELAPFMLHALERYSHLNAHFGEEVVISGGGSDGGAGGSSATSSHPGSLHGPQGSRDNSKQKSGAIKVPPPPYKVDKQCMEASLTASALGQGPKGIKNLESYYQQQGIRQCFSSGSSVVGESESCGAGSTAAGSTVASTGATSSLVQPPHEDDIEKARYSAFSRIPGAFVQQGSGEEMGNTDDAQPTSNENAENDDILTLTRFLNIVSHALTYAAKFHSEELLDTINLLPSYHAKTGFFLGTLAKCSFEKGEYSTAENFFRQMLHYSPRRSQFLDCYSTCLWHLKKDVECAHLAHSALLQWGLRGSPEVWCVLGNSFSIQKEHETAIKF